MAHLWMRETDLKILEKRLDLANFGLKMRVLFQRFWNRSLKLWNMIPEKKKKTAQATHQRSGASGQTVLCTVRSLELCLGNVTCADGVFGSGFKHV